MEIKPIFLPERPKPKGHYSPAVVHNGLIYVSGQLPFDANGEIKLGTIEEQIIQCMKNIETILKAGGSSLDHILKVGIFIADIDNWSAVNTVYAKIMGERCPARMIIPCNLLHHGCGIEIDCIAALNE